MFRVLAIVTLLCIGAAPAPSASTAKWPIDKFVRWQPQWGDRTIEGAGVRVRVELKHCGADRPSSEGCSNGTPYLVATANSEGVAPVRLEGEPGVAQYIGIGRLNPGQERPSVILVSEDGGSGGCAQIDVAVAEPSDYRAVRLDPDMNHGTICPVDAATLRWPSDLTGHGRPEFLLPWPVFHCYFTSCAGTWISQRAVALPGEKAVDVSDDPALAPLFRVNMADALGACEQKAIEAQGPCAGYAFDAARLGRLAEAWPVIDAQVRRGCRVPDENPCADVHRIPADFHRQLATALSAANLKP